MKQFIAIDMGGTFVKHALMNKDGTIVRQGKVPTPQTNIEDLVETLAGICDLYKDEDTEPGIALSSPGTVDNVEGVVRGYSAIPYIHGPKIKELITARTGRRVEMENDANCAALAEAWIGCAKGKDSAVFLVLGTGLGGSLVKAGKLHTGKGLAAGEFSSVIYDYDLEKKEYHRLAEHISTRVVLQDVANEMGIKREEIDGIKLFDWAREGNEICMRGVQRLIVHTAVLIFNIQHIYDPDVIGLGGGISADPLWLNGVKETLEDIYSKIEHFDTANLTQCQFKNDANLIGALYNYLQCTDQLD